MPLRAAYALDLQHLALQVDVMGLRVQDALASSSEVLLTGDLELAARVIAGDDAIDRMFVTLTERCYDLLSRQSPVASDLRLVVSVIRIVGDLERTGDLCLRIAKLAPEHHLLAANPTSFEILGTMAREAQELFATAVRAFTQRDLRVAHSLEQRDDAMDSYLRRLMAAILELQGPNAVPEAIQTLVAGRALERIADHSVMIGERLRYMLTGNIESLSREVGP